MAAGAFAADTGVWKVAPPPPVSWQRDRVADLSARRKALMEQIGDHAVLVLYAAEPRNYANDVDWPFRQENDFFYLTGLTQPGATLVLTPSAGKMREMVFMPRSGPRAGNLDRPHDHDRRSAGNVWNPRHLRSGPVQRLLQHADSAVPRDPYQLRGRQGRGPRRGGAANATSPANTPDWASEFASPIGEAARQELQLYMILPPRPDAVEYRREQEFAGKLASVGAGVNIKDASTLFANLRRVKSQREIEILQHAVDITAEAFQRVYAVAAPGTPEYEIQAQFEFTFLRRNGHWGYPCIVGSGNNATTLHYESNKDTMKAGDLLLMDDAAEFDQYSVDVTRTIPVSGKFSKEQADIYRLVWEAQQAGFAMAKPGHAMNGTRDSIQEAATEVFKRGLFKLGLITDPKSDAQTRIWFNHGIGHGIGLNVHDPGAGELQPGMVVTVEPGLYFRPDALENLPKTPEMEKFAEAIRPVFEKYKGIGVRIEDDVLITTGDPRIISGGIPSKLEEVEAAIARLRQAVKTTPLP